MENQKNRTIKISFSIIMIIVGILLLFIPIGSSTTDDGAIPNVWKGFLSNLGLAFIVAGVVSLYNILVTERFDRAEFVKEVTDSVRVVLSEASPLSEGLRLIEHSRHEYDGYYQWTIVRELRDLFIVGRSVLNRIDTQLQDIGSEGVAQHICKKVRAGSAIAILFVDPRSDFVKRVALEEGQSFADFLSDIKRSLEICDDINKDLAGEVVKGKLDIAVYRSFPYFAYHRHDDLEVVGFYFSSHRGESSPCYQIVDKFTRDKFKTHFDQVLAQTEKIIHNARPGSPVHFNGRLLAELRSAVEQEIGV